MTASMCRVAGPCAIALALSTTIASAQVFGVATTLSGIGTAPNACTQSYAALATEAAADWALAHVSWSGDVASNGAAPTSTWRAQLRSSEWHGVRLAAATQRAGSALCGGRSSLRQHSAALSLGGQRSGVSLQYLKRLTRDPNEFPTDTLSLQTFGPTTRGVSLAAWRRVGQALLSLSLGSRSRWRERREQFVTTVQGVDTIASDSGPIFIPGSGPSYQTRLRRGMVHRFGTELRLAWASGRVSLDMLAGHALGVRSVSVGRAWGRSDVAFAITPAVALVGGAVLDDGWGDTPQVSARRYFTLGARLTSTPFRRGPHDAMSASRAVVSAFRLQTTPGGVVTLGIRSVTARVVEVTGDFVQWRPVRMQRVSADWWELRMPMTPGMHRVNVRVDGGRWSAPPGLPRQRDEFGGDAGVFAIP